MRAKRRISRWRTRFGSGWGSSVSRWRTGRGGRDGGWGRDQRTTFPNSLTPLPSREYTLLWRFPLDSESTTRCNAQEGIMSRLMAKRVFVLAAVFCLALAAQPAQAQVAVVTVRSVESVLSDAKYVLKVAGQEDLSQQLDGMLGLLGDGKGIPGV